MVIVLLHIKTNKIGKAIRGKSVSKSVGIVSLLTIEAFFLNNSIHAIKKAIPQAKYKVDILLTNGIYDNNNNPKKKMPLNTTIE